MKINQSIFKAYDIRGKYPEEINEKTVFKIGAAFGKLTRAKEIVVGRDVRLSSDSLANYLISGLLTQDIKVIDIGLCSTPAFYFAVSHYNYPAGLMVTASHLDKEYNGIKGVFKNALPLNKKEVLEWKKITLKSKIKDSSKVKRVIKRDISVEYIASLRSFLKFPFKKYKIVMDTGNAMAGPYLKEVFKKTNLEIVYLFTDLDGNFPNRGLNPKLPENRKKLVKKIREVKADLGFLWDGDADRFYALDGEGKVIDPNFVSALIAKYLVKNYSIKKVVADIRTSKVVKDFVESVGGKIIQTPAWHPQVKFAMRKNPDAVFGSETSGHYIFKDFYYIDDGILASIFFLRAISAEKKSLKEILNYLRNKYFVLEEENFLIKKKREISKILNKLEKYYDGGKINKIDGLRIDFPNWYFNLRPSETEPLLRLNLGTDNKEILEKRRNEIAKIIKNNLD
jgi:phosphomannomutase